MPTLPEIEAFSADLVAIRHDIHANPEIGFEEVRTSRLVAEKLAEWGIEVHSGIGKTGVVGVLHGTKGPGKTIGLRADMDALPMQETTNLPYSSKNPGVFHGCGHDGHTTMLLGAARYLASHRDFAGTIHLIFQPAEEGLGGARAMIADKLFERFPCDEVYGLHNAPHMDPGMVRLFPGPAMAGADFFDIKITGHGAHGARPESSRDPIIVATALVQALQSVVSRNTDPQQAAVLSVTKIHSGSAYNVIPEEATLGGTMRFFDPATGDLMRQRMRTIAAGIAATFAVDIEVDIRPIFSVLVNHEAQTAAAVESIAKIVGAENVLTNVQPAMGSEDFADMLQAVPGCYFWVGHEGNLPLHNPSFILDDGILPVGASLLATVATDRLAAG
ncbi:hippurate hydrolase [Azorhizobium oxalatiphilum]|uniref:Hippurate hydrolase n=1 Tax=Azorhizobium oxalatiphilum TaxID=980631 RepID=A0A917C3Z8_9HYPH|nr:M20 aminoacylase family protein [Azorhizobium oxalatiphilum]GGF70641.1 hippurate hydrolase [Azorhizobium oxalatiphilum]